MKRISPVPRSAGASAHNLIGEPIVMPDPGPIYAAHLRRDVLVRGASLELSRVSAVESARPVPSVALDYTPQDPMFSRQWALNNTSQTYGCTLPSFNPGTDIHLPAALDMVGAPGYGVRVGVLDSGVHSDHPELVGRVETGFNAAADLEFLNWATEDSLSHGTAVAGIIAAASDNIGIAGIASAATIVPIRQSMGPGFPDRAESDCMADRYLWLDAALNGLWWTTNSEPVIPIVNMSWGSTATDADYPELATACLAGR